MENNLYKKSRSIRKHTRRFIRGRSKNWSLIFGCSGDEMKKHLEKQFTDGMSWDNYGLHGWHIDHISPLSLSTTLNDLLEKAHYTNLQPLWAKDNIKKSNKII